MLMLSEAAVFATAANSPTWFHHLFNLRCLKVTISARADLNTITFAATSRAKVVSVLLVALVVLLCHD